MHRAYCVVCVPRFGSGISHIIQPEPVLADMAGIHICMFEITVTQERRMLQYYFDSFYKMLLSERLQGYLYTNKYVEYNIK